MRGTSERGLNVGGRRGRAHAVRPYAHLGWMMVVAVMAHADISSRYLLHDFNNGKAVGKNVFDAGPLSDRDEMEHSKTKVLVGPVSDGAEGQGIKVNIDMPVNSALGYEYGGVYFSQDHFDASEFNTLHFQMRLPQGLGLLFPLIVAVTDDDPIYGKTDYEARLWFFLKDNTSWQDVQIPFSRLLDKRANSLRGRRITSVAFSLAKAGNYEFHLDNLEFASTHADGFLKVMDKVRPELKAVLRVLNDQDFSKATTHEEYLNLQVSPRFGYVEGRVSLAGGDNNGNMGLADFSNLSKTSRSPLQPTFFLYPKGETGISLIFDGWGKNWLGLKSISVGNNLVDYSDATYFQAWFPASTAPANSSLPMLGSARIQGEHYDVFGAFTDYQGTDASTGGLKIDFNGLRAIVSTTTLAARSFAPGHPTTPVYNDAEATLEYTWGRIKDPIRFGVWGGLMLSTDYYLTSPKGQKFFDIDNKRVIYNQKLVSPTAQSDKGISAIIVLNEFLLPGNSISLNADWIGPTMKPLFRDYYEGGVDVSYYDVADGAINMSQALWRLTLSGAFTVGTKISNLFTQGTKQQVGVAWHDIYNSGLSLSFLNIYAQEINNYNDQVSTFYDQRDRVSYEYRAGMTFAPWGEISAKYRTDADQLYSNYGGAVKEDAGLTNASLTVIEARINIWQNTRLFVTYSQETPFGYYTYYDPTLLENYSGIKLESTF